MRTKLTQEQSARLIELGVSRAKASDFDLDIKDIHNTNRPLELRPLIPIFTFTDVLKLLPKEIVADTVWGPDDHCPLDFGWDVETNTWYVGYILIPRPLELGVEPELIDALYNLLCWVLQTYPTSVK